MTDASAAVLAVLRVADPDPVPTMDIAMQIFGDQRPDHLLAVVRAVHSLASAGAIARAPDPDGRDADYWVTVKSENADKQA